jgi:hypothetical protein
MSYGFTTLRSGDFGWLSELWSGFPVAVIIGFRIVPQRAGVSVWCQSGLCPRPRDFEGMAEDFRKAAVAVGESLQGMAAS